MLLGNEFQKVVVLYVKEFCASALDCFESDFTCLVVNKSWLQSSTDISRLWRTHGARKVSDKMEEMADEIPQLTGGDGRGRH